MEPNPRSATRGRQSRADYGIDAPRALIGYGVVGAGALVVGLLKPGVSGQARVVLELGIWIGPLLLLLAAIHLWSSRIGKLREARRMVDAIPWRGDENVLDVGCGRGLLLIEAAKRLTIGKATGVDIWSSRDQSGNSPDAAMENADHEGVLDRVEIKDGDARKLPFPDGSFDVVLSSAVIHNMHRRADRKQAIREMVRVLKPGGRVSVLDIVRTVEYAQELKALGMTAVRLGRARLLWGFPTQVVTGVKPSASAALDS